MTTTVTSGGGGDQAGSEPEGLSFEPNEWKILTEMTDKMLELDQVHLVDTVCVVVKRTEVLCLGSQLGHSYLQHHPDLHDSVKAFISAARRRNLDVGREEDRPVHRENSSDQLDLALVKQELPSNITYEDPHGRVEDTMGGAGEIMASINQPRDFNNSIDLSVPTREENYGVSDQSSGLMSSEYKHPSDATLFHVSDDTCSYNVKEELRHMSDVNETLPNETYEPQPSTGQSNTSEQKSTRTSDEVSNLSQGDRNENNDLSLNIDDLQQKMAWMTQMLEEAQADLEKVDSITKKKKRGRPKGMKYKKKNLETEEIQEDSAKDKDYVPPVKVKRKYTKRKPKAEDGNEVVKVKRKYTKRKKKVQVDEGKEEISEGKEEISKEGIEIEEGAAEGDPNWETDENDGDENDEDYDGSGKKKNKNGKNKERLSYTKEEEKELESWRPYLSVDEKQTKKKLWRWKPRKCDLCDKMFFKKSSYDSHMEKHNEPEEGADIVCEKCGKVAKSERSMKVHILFTHSNERNHACPVCQKAFKTKSNLQTHLRIHTGEKSFMCDNCGRLFSTKGQLQAHERTHSGEKKYTCEVCGKGFSDARPLQGHMAQHTGKYAFQCNVCGTGFGWRRNLELHMRTHQGIEGDFKCQICGRAFHERHRLKRHMQCHSEVRPFKCHLCVLSFKRNSHLQKHLERHANGIQRIRTFKKDHPHIPPDSEAGLLLPQYHMPQIQNPEINVHL